VQIQRTKNIAPAYLHCRHDGGQFWKEETIMATAVVMPKLGNTVESSIISGWKKKKGEKIAQGETLCEIETDKATIEVECPVSGTLLELFFGEGDDVPVLTNIAAIGEPGESVDHLWPATAQKSAVAATNAEPAPAAAGVAPNGRDRTIDVRADAPASAGAPQPGEKAGISPRARNLATSKALNYEGIAGTGPGGRIIERDIQAALESRPRLTPLAQSMVTSGDFVAPPGTGGRITSKDLIAAPPISPAYGQPPAAGTDDVLQVIPLKGTRKIIAGRMLNSVQTTAQLTLNASADARMLLDYRKRLKNSPALLGLQDVTINDLVLFAVSRTLLEFPDLNALFADETITQYRKVDLGFAVDTPRGLIVPVIRSANTLSLKELAQESKRLSVACQDGTVLPDDLAGGTFTVTNLGSLGIEMFTPILNPPQVAILGVGNINLKPVEAEGAIAFIPHLGLSLTINHQVVDGAPGARFLQALSSHLTDLELVLAL
jgi:pyruvate dehydrogenase E2 component (dihydrolipoamide acetyltransferase)